MNLLTLANKSTTACFMFPSCALTLSANPDKPFSKPSHVNTFVSPLCHVSKNSLTASVAPLRAGFILLNAAIHTFSIADAKLSNEPLVTSSIASAICSAIPLTFSKLSVYALNSSSDIARTSLISSIESPKPRFLSVVFSVSSKVSPKVSLKYPSLSA